MNGVTQVIDDYKTCVCDMLAIMYEMFVLYENNVSSVTKIENDI